MIQYKKINAKLFNSQLNKLKSAMKKTRKTLKMSRKILEVDVPHELLLKTRQKTKLCNDFNYQLPINIKLSKAQILKAIQSRGSLLLC